MTRAVFDSSPEFQQKLAPIPFQTLEIGKSVIVQLSEAKEATIRTLVSVANKKLYPKHFKTKKHKQINFQGVVQDVMEIARVRDKVEGETIAVYDSSPGME